MDVNEISGTLQEMEDDKNRKENDFASPQKCMEEKLEDVILINSKLTVHNDESVDSLKPLLDNNDQMERSNAAFANGPEQNKSSITNESQKEEDSTTCND